VEHLKDDIDDEGGSELSDEHCHKDVNPMVIRIDHSNLLLSNSNIITIDLFVLFD
jgi:hypothetical protein